MAELVGTRKTLCSSSYSTVSALPYHCSHTHSVNIFTKSFSDNALASIFSQALLVCGSSVLPSSSKAAFHENCFV